MYIYFLFRLWPGRTESMESPLHRSLSPSTFSKYNKQTLFFIHLSKWGKIILNFIGGGGALLAITLFCHTYS